MPLILVADDEPLVLQVISHRLESRGFKVVAVTDGLQAINATHNFSPDLIILDAMMPGQDGFAVLKELKANTITARIPVLMLTARRTEKDIVAALNAGAADYLVKPFNVEELFTRVKRLLK
jgi:DNA-binding response OmpR family regulator